VKLAQESLWRRADLIIQSLYPFPHCHFSQWLGGQLLENAGRNVDEPNPPHKTRRGSADQDGDIGGVPSKSDT
jgi:hypothetical protein